MAAIVAEAVGLAHLHNAHDYIRLYDGSPDVLRGSLARIQSAATTILTRLGVESRLTPDARADAA